MDVVSIGESMVLFTPNTNGQMRYANTFNSHVVGAETNTLIGLAKLGHKVGWISRLGKDELGEKILSAVRGEGVDTSEVILDNGASTGILFKEKMSEKNIRIYYYRSCSAASLLSPKDIDENYIAKAKYLYITGITPALSQNCRESIFYSIQIAKEKGLEVIFDPNLRLKLWGEDEARKTLIEISRMSDVVLPGVHEGEFLFGSSDCTEIAKQFHQLGVKTVIVKRGEKGAYYSTPTENGFVQGYNQVNPIDPVGAGDGFAAGILSGMIDELTIEESVQRGCAIGAMVTTVNGDIEGLPNRDLLFSFMNSIHSDVQR
mgnify:CR=1 FL=1